MSYILDALRRADAERERDPARGIHAQPAAGAPPRRAPVPTWAWAALGAVLVAAAAVAWLQRPAALPPSALPARTLAPVPPPVVLPVAASVTPAAAPVSAPPPVATSVTPAAPPMPPPVERPRAPVAQPSAVPPAGAASAPAAAAATAALPASAPALAAASAPAGAAARAAAADRVYNVAELPADVQQGLPKLAISGGVYSDNAAQRMLVVGGQVVSEGAELAPGVVLEQIRARAAVLRFRGYRYSVPY